MSDDKIQTVYICSICHTSYDTKAKAEQCVKSHEKDKLVCQIELALSYKGQGTCYTFHKIGFRVKGDTAFRIVKEVKLYGLYDGYPKFMVECFNTDDDIFAAKKQLIAAAYEWVDKYKEVLAGLERKLEEER